MACCGRCWRGCVGAEVRVRLGTSKVRYCVQAAWRVGESKQTRGLPAKCVVKPFRCTDIAEVGGCSTVETAAPWLLGGMAGGHLRHRGAEALVDVDFEDVHLASVARALGYVCQIELVGQGVDDASLRGRQGRREGHAVTVGGLLEEEEL